MKARFLSATLVLAMAIPLAAQIEVGSGGNVGIGTASPSYKLDVNGVANATDFRGPVGSTTSNTGAFTTITATGSVRTTGGSPVTGAMWKDTTSGLVLTGVTGSSYDFAITTPGVALAMAIPAGTANAVFFGNVVSGTNVQASGSLGFSATTFALNARNPIYYFNNANAYGVSYFQGTSGFDGVSDSIGFHFGTATSAASSVNIRAVGIAVTGTQLVTGAVRFSNYGAGTAMFDSSGNITSISDERMKDTIGDFTTGLDVLCKLQPKKYHWNRKSGLNTDDLNVSVYAQDLLAAGVPEAVFAKSKEGIPNGGGKADVTYTVSDRAVISVIINAAKELAVKNDALEARVAALEARLK